MEHQSDYLLKAALGGRLGSGSGAYTPTTSTPQVATPMSDALNDLLNVIDMAHNELSGLESRLETVMGSQPPQQNQPVGTPERGGPTTLVHTLNAADRVRTLCRRIEEIRSRLVV